MGVGSVAGNAPDLAGPRLWVQQIDARIELEEAWGELRLRLQALVSHTGVGQLRARELAVLPGFEEAVTLSAVLHQAECGDFDVVVVDCAPTAETIRLLSLPQVLRWWLDRFSSVTGTPGRDPGLGALAGPLEAVLSMMLPGRSDSPGRVEPVLRSLGSLGERLEAAEALMTNPTRTLVRLVTGVEPAVLAETRRLTTYLAMFGFSIDGVVANMLVPDDGEAVGWLSERAADQRVNLERLEDEFAPMEVMRAPLHARPPVGLDALDVLGLSIYGEEDPTGGSGAVNPLRFDQAASSLELDLAHVDPGDIGIARSGADLLVTIGPFRRAVTLPDSMSSLQVSEARFSSGTLSITFASASPR